MSTVLEPKSGARRDLLPRWKSRAAPLALVAGLLALYVPTCIGLARTLWREEDYAHGPIILAVALFLFWTALKKPGTDPGFVKPGSVPGFVGGFLLLVPGLALYIVGQSQGLPIFATASMIPVAAGIVFAIGGLPLLRRCAFALLFLAFLVPLPGFVVEAATGPLKELVSAIVAALLGALGYPIERAGVVLDVAGHQMLVADACSGMNSIVSLTALTLLYAHLTGPSAARRWIVLLAAVVPIAIAANVLRVLVLVLVAYHFGDAASQGAVHTLAGLLVFAAAFLMLVGLDSSFGLRRLRHEVNAAPSKSSLVLRTPTFALFAAAALMIASSFAAPLLEPVHAEGPAPVLERMVPQAFGDWSIDNSIEPVAPTADVKAKLDRIYDQTLSRTYVNSAGERMMLTVAYGGDQSDALKAHRQEVCYRAQGFSIESLGTAELALPGRTIPVTRMFAVREDRPEPVTYWFTMGDRVVRGRLDRLGVQVRDGLGGRIPDGVLVRVSSISADPQRAYAAQQSFAAALISAMDPQDRARLAGAAHH